MLVITICATKSYTYAMRAQARRVAANVREMAPGHLVLVGDESKEMQDVAKVYAGVLPEGWHVHLLGLPDLDESGENYKQQAQLLIARMRTEAFTLARKIGATRCWSLDSDVLPPDNALRCSLQILEFDGGYYAVAACPYQNGMFLGGRGTPQHPIAENVLPEERQLPWHLARAWRACLARLSAGKQLDREAKRLARLKERIEARPPQGNVFALNGKQWRARGWLEWAYPGIGRGAVVPSDWCGFGCTLMNEAALATAHFDGYEGAGTEDLFIVWRRWYPSGLRIATLTHCPCSHVIWDRKKKNGDPSVYTLHEAYHETEGEMIGHLRSRSIRWRPEALPPTGPSDATPRREKKR